MKIDQVFDNQHKPKRLHRADCKHRGAGGNSSQFRKATPVELRTLPECFDCAREARKPVETRIRQRSRRLTRPRRDRGCVGAYGWPVKPFDRAHPIRGGFGDPRTVFAGRRSKKTLLEGDGTFSFHQGLDISAPDGSPVFSVSSGTVVRARGDRVTVDCGNGRKFQYWHIEPAVRVGQRAVAGRTLLGFVQEKREHVHLTHLERGRAVNPLAPGRLTPYRDRTVPRVLAITIVRGAFVAEAIDMPSLPVPGRWHGFPVTPALVTWRMESASGRVVAGPRIARDVRRTVPKNDRFWAMYARGTHQNWPVFDGSKQQGLKGRYLFRLAGAQRAPGDVIVVTASDIAGNRGVRRLALDAL